MSSEGKILRKLSLRRWILAIIILCTTVCWAPAETLAREAAPAALNMTAHSTLWSFEGPGINNAPYLVIGKRIAETPRPTVRLGSLRTKQRIRQQGIR
jgi:hypothetical protein